MKKMSLAQKQKITTGFLVAALIAAIVCREGTLSHLWVVLVMLGLGLNMLWLRCPHCGAMLGRHTTDTCKICGEKIDWNEKPEK